MKCTIIYKKLQCRQVMKERLTMSSLRGIEKKTLRATTICGKWIDNETVKLPGTTLRRAIQKKCYPLMFWSCFTPLLAVVYKESNEMKVRQETN